MYGIKIFLVKGLNFYEKGSDWNGDLTICRGNSWRIRI